MHRDADRVLESDQTLRQAEETVGWLEQQAAETTAQCERRVSHFEAQAHTIEQALATALTEGGQRLAHARETVHELEHEGVETAAQLERRLRRFEAQSDTIEQTLATALTEGDQRLAKAQETVRGLEHQGAEMALQFEQQVRHFEAETQTIERALFAAVTGSVNDLLTVEETVDLLELRATASMELLERRIEQVDAQNSTIEPAVAEATRVGAVTSALEARLAPRTASVRTVVQTETAIGQLESVRQQLLTLMESARSSVKALGAIDISRPTVWKIRIRRPQLRWAAVFGALVAVNLLGIYTLLTPDQPGRIAGNARAALQESPAPVPLPSTPSHFAMFEMPA